MTRRRAGQAAQPVGVLPSAPAVLRARFRLAWLGRELWRRGQRVERHDGSRLLLRVPCLGESVQVVRGPVGLGFHSSSAGWLAPCAQAGWAAEQLTAPEDAP